MIKIERVILSVLGALMILIGVMFLIQGIDLIMVVLFDHHVMLDTSKKIINSTSEDCDILRIAGASVLLFFAGSLVGVLAMVKNRDV